jgi:hypothetical protein
MDSRFETETVSVSHTHMSTPSRRKSNLHLREMPELKNAIEKMNIQERKLNVKFKKILKKKN